MAKAERDPSTGFGHSLARQSVRAPELFGPPMGEDQGSDNRELLDPRASGPMSTAIVVPTTEPAQVPSVIKLRGPVPARR